MRSDTADPDRGLAIGRPSQFEWLKTVIVLIFVLNVFDGIMTTLWVVSGTALEANPLMAELIVIHPLLFMFIKLTLIALGSALLWRHRQRPLVVVAIFLLFLVYYVITVLHSQEIGSYISLCMFG